MGLKQSVKGFIQRLMGMRFIGWPVRIMAAMWRGPQTRESLERLTERLRVLSNGYEAAIKGFEQAMQRHESALNHHQEAVNALVRDEERLNQLEAVRLPQDESLLRDLVAESERTRKRIEFVRSEIFFELRKSIGAKPEDPKREVSSECRVINADKVQGETKRLNLGCGPLTKPDYINVDGRELPGVDLVCDVTKLPFAPQSVDTVLASHLIEHFPDKMLRDVVLPHWHKILKPHGEFIIIVPDTGAMIESYFAGRLTFDALREVTFGSQEYDGNFHFNMFTNESLTKLLHECGFAHVETVAVGRQNGLCLEMEIHASPVAP